MALKIVYPICCGIDVHKTFVVACIASTNKGVTTYKCHRFSTYTKGLRELSQWLCEHDCKDVCMESTGKYWIPARSRWHIRNMSKRSAVKRRTKRMRNGLPIYSSMT
ncbi:Mobile element protein [Desulfosporosinus metallidurans]|uniref:Mobile element protein n=1 Tax=Desulfosporosinus metallidurans TaxID=1888891 RepID=A0A1Q8QW15_9FIRM|nr:Mobile element protein [Desulfosporosinus metallidurans]